jgi:hypothetical protein
VKNKTKAKYNCIHSLNEDTLYRFVPHV